MKAVICPVCEGKGQIKDAEIMGPEVTEITTKLCHGCSGKGWVEVNEAYLPYEPTGLMG